MKSVTNQPDLGHMADRLALVVTDLNGLRSQIVNEEITAWDFEGDLRPLFDKLRAVERVVGELGDIFYSYP